MSSACVVFDDLTLGYRSRPAVHHLNGTLRSGSLTALTGPNGSGKSTLMKGIAGALAPLAGTCTLAPGTRAAYLPQQSALDRSFPARTVDLVSLGLWPRRGAFGRHRREDRAAVAAALDAVGLDGFARRPVDTLSGGQLQRALFARVLVQDADLILLDEPFNAIDARTVADLVCLIELWHAQGRTVLVVLHDLELARARFPQALLLARELVAWDDARVALDEANLARARSFQAAWDERAPWCPASERRGTDAGGAPGPGPERDPGAVASPARRAA